MGDSHKFNDTTTLLVLLENLSSYIYRGGEEGKFGELFASSPPRLSRSMRQQKEVEGLGLHPNVCLDNLLKFTLIFRFKNEFLPHFWRSSLFFSKERNDREFESTDFYGLIVGEMTNEPYV